MPIVNISIPFDGSALHLQWNTLFALLLTFDLDNLPNMFANDVCNIRAKNKLEQLV